MTHYRFMKRVSVAAMAILVFSGALMAQDAGRRGWVYGYAGIGGASQSSSLHLGGGGTVLVAGGFGLEGELARFGSTASHVDNSISVISANLAYHFGGRNLTRKLIPFGTGGLSIADRRSGGGNFGFGVQYWAYERVALRFEFREHIFSSDSPFIHGFHIGLAFR